MIISSSSLNSSTENFPFQRSLLDCLTLSSKRFDILRSIFSTSVTLSVLNARGLDDYLVLEFEKKTFLFEDFY